MRTYADLTAMGWPDPERPPPPFELPIRGRLYSFPAIPADPVVNAKLRVIGANNEAVRSGTLPVDRLMRDDPALFEGLLGAQAAAMSADGVSEAERDHVVTTLVLYYVLGPAPAELYWHGGIAGATGERS